MRFGDLLRTTVMLSAGSATMLAVVTAVSASRNDQNNVFYVMAGWWAVATVVGLWVGRRAAVAPAIGKLLADAKAATTMPEHRPGQVVLNRLWPLVLVTIVAGGFGIVAPQLPGIACGFTIIWALAWRKQPSAVLAIEERDGVSFYVERTSPVRPIQLVRTPGFRREVPSVNGVTPPR
jgi:hypothetical protein